MVELFSDRGQQLITKPLGGSENSLVRCDRPLLRVSRIFIQTLEQWDSADKKMGFQTAGLLSKWLECRFKRVFSGIAVMKAWPRVYLWTVTGVVAILAFLSGVFE